MVRLRPNKKTRAQSRLGRTLRLSLPTPNPNQVTSQEQLSRLWVAANASATFKKRARRGKWSSHTVQAGVALINAYAGIGDDVAFTLELGAGLSSFQEELARQYFAGAVVRAVVPPVGAPGQQEDWFMPHLRRAEQRKALLTNSGEQ